MSPSLFLDYPFTFNSTVSINLKPYSDIEDPDKVITVLLEESKLYTCLSENEQHPDKQVSKAIENIKETEITFYPNRVKILQLPIDVSRKEPYLCEVTLRGVFTLNASIKSPDIIKNIIEFLVVNKLGSLNTALAGFNAVMDDYYEDYQEVIEMAYDSIKFVSKGDFQVGEPIKT